MALTKENIITLLQTDPSFLIKVICENNGKAVENKIRDARIKSDMRTTTPYDVVMALYNLGNHDAVAALINVDYIPGVLPDGYDEIFAELYGKKQLSKPTPAGY